MGSRVEFKGGEGTRRREREDTPQLSPGPLGIRIRRGLFDSDVYNQVRLDHLPGKPKLTSLFS